MLYDVGGREVGRGLKAEKGEGSKRERNIAIPSSVTWTVRY
jgi:hypothetical protein